MAEFEPRDASAVFDMQEAGGDEMSPFLRGHAQFFGVFNGKAVAVAALCQQLLL